MDGGGSPVASGGTSGIEASELVAADVAMEGAVEVPAWLGSLVGMADAVPSTPVVTAGTAVFVEGAVTPVVAPAVAVVVALGCGAPDELCPVDGVTAAADMMDVGRGSTAAGLSLLAQLEAIHKRSGAELIRSTGVTDNKCFTSST